MSATVAIRRALPTLAPRTRGAVREQALVASGQLASGLGNLAFTLVMARVLEPAAFAQLAAFMALFLLIYLPTRSLSAGSALTPELAVAARKRTAGIGLAAGAAICALGIPLAATLGISVTLVLALATTPPLAGLVALERGRLYGERRHGRVFASLVVEPAVRLGAGVALALGLGVAGAGLAVVGGSVAALLVAAAPGRRPATGLAGAGAGRAESRLAIAGFLCLAVIQAQDVIFANATLGDGEAASFAVLSTLGGVAAFATTTVPLVMLPQARDREAGALRVALGATALLGAAAIAPAMVAPELVLELGFGSEFVDLAPLAGPYLVAMALLGIARVLVANAAATGAGKLPIAIAGAGALLQLGLLVELGDSAAGVANATLVSTAALTGVLAAAEALRLRRPAFAPAPSAEARASGSWRRWRLPIALGALVIAGLAVRIATDRSLWLDEATTWYQSQLPFSTMLADLRATDVHPPGHHALVWLAARGFGDGELALRLPSLLAGAALIPMMFVAGRALFDRRTGVIAAGLATVAPICVWYSEEARMYAQVMLLGLVSVWALYRALESDRYRYWLAYAVAAAAMVWTHYFAALTLITLQVAMVVLAWRGRDAGDERRRLRRLAGPALASVAIAVLLAPLAPFALDQFMANEAAGKGFDQPDQAGGAVDKQVSLYGALTNGIWAIWGYHSDVTMASLAALWPLLMLLALALLGRGRSRPGYLLTAAVLVPGVLLTVIAVAHPFLFELRYNVAAVPLLLLLIAAVVSRWPRRNAMRWAVAGLAGATLALGTVDQQLNGSNPRVYDFEGALGEIADRSGGRDLLVYDPVELNNVIEYYAPGVEKARLASADFDGERLAATDPGGRAARGRAKPAAPPTVATAERVFVLSSFRDDGRNVSATADAIAKLREQRRLVDRFARPQVKVWVFR